MYVCEYSVGWIRLIGRWGGVYGDGCIVAARWPGVCCGRAAGLHSCANAT